MRDQMQPFSIGHCYDNFRNPAKGLQLNLGTPKNPEELDTIVMANLGYFQFQAGPGVWNMTIHKGKSSQIYMFDDERQHESRLIIVSDFKGEVEWVRVRKRSEMEAESLLEDSEDSPSAKIWDSVMNL